MDPDQYFQIIIWMLMAVTFFIIALIFLHMIYGREEEKEEK